MEENRSGTRKDGKKRRRIICETSCARLHARDCASTRVSYIDPLYLRSSLHHVFIVNNVLVFEVVACGLPYCLINGHSPSLIIICAACATLISPPKLSPKHGVGYISVRTVRSCLCA